MSGDISVDKLLQTVLVLYGNSSCSPTCVCELATTGIGSAGSTNRPSGCRGIPDFRCKEPLCATELAHHVLRICEGFFPGVAEKRSNRVLAAVLVKLAETLFGENASKTFDFSESRGLDRIALCKAAIDLCPPCAAAYAALAPFLTCDGRVYFCGRDPCCCQSCRRRGISRGAGATTHRRRAG